MPRLVDIAGQLVERIKINTISREVRDGRVLWVKARRRPAGLVLAFANAFFRAAGAPLQALADISTWQHWELQCFQGLHGDRFHSFAPDDRSIAAEEVPGVNLTVFLDGGTITPPMAAAAGRELRRAHQTNCPQFDGPWSHGDPHLGNFVYEPNADRARLIDFEVLHDRTLAAPERHADDLLVFLQDMGGRIGEELWLPCALAFLEAYGCPQIVSLLRPRLAPPALPGFARLWWAIRTSYLAASIWQLRIAALEREIQSVSNAGLQPPWSGLHSTTHSVTG